MYSRSSLNIANRVRTNLVRRYWLKIGMCHRLIDYIRRVAITERYQFQKIFLIKYSYLHVHSPSSKYIIYIGSHTPLHTSLPDIEASPEILWECFKSAVFFNAPHVPNSMFRRQFASVSHINWCLLATPSLQPFLQLRLSSLKTALFWALIWRVVVIPYRRFGTTCRSHLHGSRIQTISFLLGFLALDDRIGR